MGDPSGWKYHQMSRLQLQYQAWFKKTQLTSLEISKRYNCTYFHIFRISVGSCAHIKIYDKSTERICWAGLMSWENISKDRKNLVVFWKIMGQLYIICKNSTKFLGLKEILPHYLSIQITLQMSW